MRVWHKKTKKKQATTPISGGDYPSLTFIYPDFDSGSHAVDGSTLDLNCGMSAVRPQWQIPHVADG